MCPRTCLLALLAAIWAPAQAGDADAELALRLFGEREAARRPAPPYGWPAPRDFSAQALEEQNRAMLCWLRQFDAMRGWPSVPPCPPGYPIGRPLLPPAPSSPPPHGR